MSILSKATRGLLGKPDEPAPPEGIPDPPPATIAYTLAARTDGDYDVLDGVVLAGLISRVEGDGDRPTTWKAHVRDADANFGTLEAAKAWLGQKRRK